ncbi:MAG: hypothetical protein DRI79_07060 [Chloroflexi bacterium]|nr:MAG: hypothetical protein DRI79_07060 [Chloroflexota bacterium]
MGQIPAREVQEFLRLVMEEWGKPKRLQVDNGNPWEKGKELPSALALWLMGLGIEVVWIPPGKPQYNGVVERAQGVLQQWAEPKEWRDEEEGQERLDWAVQMQRAGYRGGDGKTRMERFPQLRTNPRRYLSETEEEQWSLEEMDKRLATGQRVRKVGRTEQIYLYNRPYGVGREYARQTVFVRRDAMERVWRVTDESGQEIKVLKPKQFDRETIRSPDIAYVKPSKRKGHNIGTAR